MARNVIRPVFSLKEFSHECAIKKAAAIDVCFSAPVKSRGIRKIDPFGAMRREYPLITVPLEVRCEGRAESIILYYKMPLSRHLVAYFEKPLAGDTLSSRFPLNLDDICHKAERYAELLALRTKEYAAGEGRPYNLTINLFIDVLPYGKKQKILELRNQEIDMIHTISADDYASILAAQRPSNPCL